MRACGDDVRELIHDGCPVACVEDVAFGYVNAFRSHVNVGFFHGAALKDPAGLLEGAGKRMRHVKLKPMQSFNSATRCVNRRCIRPGQGNGAVRVMESVTGTR